LTPNSCNGVNTLVDDNLTKSASIKKKFKLILNKFLIK